MGDYYVYQCKHCESTIVNNKAKDLGEYGLSSTFHELNDVMVCCSEPSIGWATNQDPVCLPDNEEIEIPGPRRSRVELVLEDVANG